MSELFVTGGTNRPRAENKTALELPKTHRESELCSPRAAQTIETPMVIPSGPLACANQVKNKNFHSWLSSELDRFHSKPERAHPGTESALDG